jgi:hypothetical protein
MGYGLALRKLNCGDRPLTIVAPDRDSQTVMLVKPNLLHRPSLSIGEDYGLADKLSLGLTERAEDRGRTELNNWHGWFRNGGKYLRRQGEQVVTRQRGPHCRMVARHQA